LSSESPTVASGHLSATFSPWHRSLVTPLNTRGAGAAERSLINALSHESFLKSRFTRHYVFNEKQSRVDRTLHSFLHVSRQKVLVSHDISSTTATVSSQSG